MQVVTIDFETYWSTEFSLSKISFVEYIQSPEFEAISVAIKIGNGMTTSWFGSQVGPALRAIDWSNSACVAHNGNEFDFPLLVWKYDCHPKLFVDTLCLARPKHQSVAGGSLKKLSEHYSLPAKNNTVLLNTKGKRLDDFSIQETMDMAAYNRQDVENTYTLFQKFTAPDPGTDTDDLRELSKRLRWAKKELKLSDMTARMVCYPQFDCDIDLLQSTLDEAEALKDKQLMELVDLLGVLDVEEVRTALASAPKFAAVLDSLGVEPPRKISKTTGKETYALAKTDEEFTALLDHDDARVQMVTAARLGVKSTLLETRLAKMATCARLLDGKITVPLAYHAATTGRWGGRVWNPQNLPRISRNKDGSVVPKLTNALRMSLRAPAGYKIVVSDLSGIELRVNHYLWDVESTRELYATDPEADLYKDFAAALFGKTVGEITKDERQLAKVAQLGLGFGAGAKTFKKVAKLMGGIDLDDEEALRVTKAWRSKYSDIVDGWESCQHLIHGMYVGANVITDPRELVQAVNDGKGDEDTPACTTRKLGRMQPRGGSEFSVRLPSGRQLYYPHLERLRDEETGKHQYWYGVGRNRSKVYSGLMCENLVQGIARDVIAEQALTVWEETGYFPALTVHDELVYVVPSGIADSHLRTVNMIMRKPPSWLPGIVLWSEGDIADSYGLAK